MYSSFWNEHHLKFSTVNILVCHSSKSRWHEEQLYSIYTIYLFIPGSWYGSLLWLTGRLLHGTGWWNWAIIICLQRNLCFSCYIRQNVCCEKDLLVNLFILLSVRKQASIFPNMGDYSFVFNYPQLILHTTELRLYFVHIYDIYVFSRTSRDCGDSNFFLKHIYFHIDCSVLHCHRPYSLSDVTLRVESSNVSMMSYCCVPGWKS